MKPASKRFKIILSICLILIVVFGIWASAKTPIINDITSSLTNSSNEETMIQDYSNLELEKDSKPTKDFYENLNNIPYSDLVAKAPNVVSQPNINNEDLKNEISKKVKFNEDPSNTIVVITNEGVDSPIVTINRGDFVTWENKTDAEIMVNGKEGWSSIIPIKPGEKFTQLFDYIGDYEYKVGELNNISGNIKVVTLH